MQSGITASKELVSAFNDLLGSPSSFALVVTITKEALTPVATIPATSPTASFSDNLPSLKPHITTTDPLYIILRRFPGEAPPNLSAVTYIPDTAKVRSKMLFASTRLTLTRELGTEHFRESLFCTLPDELTASGFDRLDRHAALDAPLTEEERTLGEVKRAEAEAGAGTGVREIHLSKNMNMPISQEALGKLSELGKGQGAGIVMMVSWLSLSLNFTKAPRTTKALTDKAKTRKSTVTPKPSSSTPPPRPQNHHQSPTS